MLTYAEQMNCGRNARLIALHPLDVVNIWARSVKWQKNKKNIVPKMYTLANPIHAERKTEASAW